MKRFILFLMALNGIVSYGQNITGRVTDTSNQPIEYANIVAMTADSLFVSGATSDSLGNFCLSLPEQPPYATLLKISFVGYEDKYLSCSSCYVGSIQLAPSAVQLNGVTVKVPRFNLSSEGLQTNVSGTLLGRAGTANDVLKQIPTVQGRDGNFTVFGKGTPLICINGKEVRNNVELEMLSSEDILNVKVITNPGSKYDNEVKAVILIKTKRKAGDGLGGQVRSVYKQGFRSKFTEQASLNYRKDRLDVFANLYYDNMYLKQTQTNIQNIYGKLTQNGNTNILTHIQDLYGSAGLNYEFNDKHSIGAIYSIERQPGNYVTNIENLVSKPDSAIHNVNYRHDGNMPKGTDHRLNTYYNGRVGKLQIDYNFDYLFKKSRKSQLTTMPDNAENPICISTINRANNNLLASKIILSYPLGNGQIEAGSEYTYTRRKETFVNKEQLLDNTDDRINESNTTAFAKYSLQCKPWTMSAGVRYQFTRSDYFQDETKSNEQSRRYGKWLPAVSVSYGKNKFQTNLSYGAKMTRPAYYMLASNVQYDDQYTYEGGNPLLQPSVYQSLNLEMMYDWVYLAAGYVHKKDEMLNVDKPYDNQAILFTYDNINKVDEVNATLSLSPRFGCWEPAYSISVNKQFLDNKAIGVTEKLGKPMFVFALNNSFSLPKDWMIGVDYNYNTSGHSGTVLVKHSNRLDLRINKSFFKNQLSLSLQANDIFKGSYNSSIFYGSNMSMNIRNYSDSRNFQVSIVYRFNYTRSKYKGYGAGEEEKERL